MTTTSANPSKREGPDKRGPSTTHTIGTAPEHRTNAPATFPHPSSVLRSSSGAGPADTSHATSGNLRDKAVSAAPTSLAAATAPRARPALWTSALTTGRSPGRRGAVLTEAPPAFPAVFEVAP